MAMTPAGMSAQIKAGIIAQFGTPADATLLQKFCDAVAGVTSGIVPYIQASAVVPSGIAVSTTGSATNQSGATTAPGAIT